MCLYLWYDGPPSVNFILVRCYEKERRDEEGVPSQIAELAARVLSLKPIYYYFIFAWQPIFSPARAACW